MSATTAQAVDYYVAAENGSDSWDGLAPYWQGGTRGPWSTLNKASNPVYGAGSRIYLKRGKIWLETLTLSGQGTVSNRNLVGAYGSGANPQIRGTSDEQGGNMGIRMSTPDYWTIENIDFNQLWRGIEVVLYTPGHQSLEIRNCNFWTNNAYVLRTQTNDWPTPAATGIQIEGSGAGVSGGADILTGVTIDNCRFTMMGQSIGVNNYGHNQNYGLVRNTLISNCVMENGTFIQLAAVGAHDFTVRNTKIWNNGVNIWNGPANFVFYGVNYLPYPANQTNLLVEDCEIGFNYVCDATGCSPSDGEGIELQGVTKATFRRVLFHHNDATAVLVNSPCTGVEFESCVFAADEAYDVNGSGGCEQYGEFRLHEQLTATFSGCRFLPRSSLPAIPQRPFAVSQVPDIPKVGTCAPYWHSGITYSNTTTSEYGKETHGANLAIGASSSQNPAARTWQYSFGTPQTIDTVVLTETPGAGIRKFVVQYWDATTGTWKDAYTGKNIGTSIYDYYLAFPARTTTAIRVQILDSNWPSSVGLNGFEVYKTNGTNPTDQFLSTTLNSSWSWVPRSVGPGWNLFDHFGFLRMATDGQDLWGWPGGTPSTILLRPIPTGDWTATMRLEFSPAQDYQQAGLILYLDDDNYLKLVYGHDSAQPNGTALEFTSESGGAPSQQPKVGMNSSGIYLRLVKSGSTYFGYWSVDGTNWQTWPGVWQFSGLNLNSARIGLLAQGVGGAYPDFDSFDIR